MESRKATTAGTDGLRLIVATDCGGSIGPLSALSDLGALGR